MRFTTGGLDLATGALVLGGVGLIVVSLVGAAALLRAPTAEVEPTASAPRLSVPVATAASVRPSIALSADRVAAVLVVDATTGAGSAARLGDHVDVLGYFSRQVIGSESVTRMLLEDVAVLEIDRSGAGVALTLAVPHEGALLLHEAQAIGARPFVTLRSVRPGAAGEGVPQRFSDTELAERLAGGH
jgi:hypothetical protein